jgi:hypothetical protein
MDWKIEVTEPVTAASTRAALERARDEWVRTTPQVTDTSAAQAAAVVPTLHNAAREGGVKLLAKIVADNSKTLDAHHQAVVRQMDAGIASAELIAKSLPAGTHVRVSVFGHFKPGHPNFLDERVTVCVDQARPAVAVEAKPSPAVPATP